MESSPKTGRHTHRGTYTDEVSNAYSEVNWKYGSGLKGQTGVGCNPATFGFSVPDVYDFGFCDRKDA